MQTASSIEVTSASLLPMIQNPEEIYRGNLVYYFKTVFLNAKNLNHPYHNFRHSFHVPVLCYDACLYYPAELTHAGKRGLLIAGMFHDFDHSGKTGNDGAQIQRAVEGLERHILREDRELQSYIVSLIRMTQFPYMVPSNQLDLLGQIIRDADMAQCLSPVWIQQTIFGLAAEAGKSPLEMLHKQPEFLAQLKFSTDWAKERFNHLIEARQEEVAALLSFLN